MEYILYETREQIGLLTVNRPKALNALNSVVLSELSELLDEIAKSNIRCLIVTGAGEKAFVAGADIAEMKDLDSTGAKGFSIAGNAVMNKLEQLPMPTIAAVNGYALGGGCELALACDIRIASEQAVFSLPEVSLGVLPGYGGIQRLIRILGLPKAKELVFTCDRLGATDAQSLGLVNKVAPKEELLESAFLMARKIAGNAPFAVREAKRVSNCSIGLNLDEAYNLEADAFAACFEIEDQKLAMNAFLEKRKCEPFTGKRL